MGKRQSSPKMPLAVMALCLDEEKAGKPVPETCTYNPPPHCWVSACQHRFLSYVLCVWNLQEVGTTFDAQNTILHISCMVLLYTCKTLIHDEYFNAVFYNSVVINMHIHLYMLVFIRLYLILEFICILNQVSILKLRYIPSKCKCWHHHFKFGMCSNSSTKTMVFLTIVQWLYVFFSTLFSILNCVKIQLLW